MRLRIFSLVILFVHLSGATFGQSDAAVWLKKMTGNAINKPAHRGAFSKAPPGYALYFSHAGKIDFPYVVYVPRSYDPARPISLVVFLHGAILAKDSFQFKDPAIADEPVFSVADELQTIVIFPFARSDFKWSGNSLAFPGIVQLILESEEYYNIDTKRIYIGGISMGGNATFWFVNNKPEMFAGFYAFSSMPAHSGDPLKCGNITEEKPLYTMNAKDDPGFSYSEAHEFYEQHKSEAPGWHFGAVETGGHRFIYTDNGRQFVKSILGILLTAK